jgi:hypothetical protein
VALKEFRREDNRPFAPRWWGGRKEIREMTVNASAPLSGTMDVDEFMAFMETRPKGEHWDGWVEARRVGKGAGYSLGIGENFRAVPTIGAAVGTARQDLNHNHGSAARLCPPYFIANGLTGEPTAPVIGIAGATNMNS